MKFLKKIFPIFNTKKQTSNISEEKDELIGVWENDLDDGSGLHYIWGWSFQFNEDSTGNYTYWNEQKIENEIKFSWCRIDQHSVKVKYEDADNWTIIEYSLQVVDAPYAGKLMKLTDKNYVSTDLAKEGFWGCVGAIFKVI